MSGRAIDRHEPSISHVLDLVDETVTSMADACAWVVEEEGLDMTPERLEQLVRCWCAVAGPDVTAVYFPPDADTVRH